MTPCKVTAEIGCTHIGDMDRARHLISLAKESGADTVKFQKRNPVECVPKHLLDKPHPNEQFSYGKTYLEHRQKLELSIGQHVELEKFSQEIGIKYAISVFDMTSAKEVVRHLRPEFIKVPSCANHNLELMQFLFENFSAEVHISTGMTCEQEISELQAHLIGRYPLKRWMIYHCTSEYPCPFEHLYLLNIDKWRNGFKNDVRIGFSNHGYGIAADIAAYVLGATRIERHFIDDRNFRHTDACASLEPAGLQKLCRDLKHVHQAMSYKETLSTTEWAERNKLRVNHD